MDTRDTAVNSLNRPVSSTAELLVAYSEVEDCCCNCYYIMGCLLYPSRENTKREREVNLYW